MGKVNSTRSFMNRYSNNEKTTHKRTTILRIVICVFLYAVTIFIQQTFGRERNIAGVLAQLQVMVSTYLVITVKKPGLIIAVCINTIQSLMIAFIVLVRGYDVALPGIFVPLCTILTLNIISFYDRNLNLKLKEVTAQKKELTFLNEELVASEEEVRHQNEQLIAYNDLMKKNEERLNHLAYIDILTELPNRKMIINRVDLLINLATKSQLNFAVVFIDLDNFKRINDSKGHHVGDMLLREVVRRMQEMLYDEDLLGRLGGDEFALIIQHFQQEEDIFEYVESIRMALLRSFTIENMEFNISASTGIAIYPQDGADSTEILKSADTAMYKSKEYGKNGSSFYNKEMNEEILRRIEFENKLCAAIQKKEMFLVYQPQYYSATKKLRGFEVLSRWLSPDLGMVSPVRFIPIAEEIGYILPMGEWILRTACQAYRKMKESYNMCFIISVNVSSVQVMDTSFIPMVRRVLLEEQVSGEWLEFEITESVFISSVEYVIHVIQELKRMGIHIALDDFGTGYSSLSYLQKLPIDTLKIDKSFIDSIIEVSSSKQIVGSIIELVHRLDIEVIAEGVEEEKQLIYLNEHNCDYIQGYLWGKPAKEEEVLDLLRTIQEQEN